jgi:hypothetical protein
MEVLDVEAGAILTVEETWGLLFRARRAPGRQVQRLKKGVGLARNRRVVASRAAGADNDAAATRLRGASPERDLPRAR